MLALKRQFMWPVLAVVLVDFVFMVAGASRLASGGDSFWIWLCWAGIVTLVVDGYTLCWVGMWTGCVAKRPNRASSATIARVLVLPWGGLVGVVLLLSFTTLWRQLDDKFGAYFLLGLWFALGMIVDVYFCVRSRVRLLRDLRQVATERFAPGRRLGFSLKQRRKQPGPVLPPVVAGET